MNKIKQITYNNEQCFSNYHNKESLINQLEIADTEITIIGFVIWESEDKIAISQGFNRRFNINTIIIGKNQIIEEQDYISDNPPSCLRIV